MPVQTVSQICRRIKHATKDRSISVFVVNIKGTRKLDAIFANTTESKRRQLSVKPFHPSDKCPTCGHITKQLAEEYLGDFHWEMPAKDVREFLTTALET